MRYQTGPAVLINFPTLWQSWPQITSALQEHTGFIHLYFFDIKLVSPKRCIFFSEYKDLQHEASTHPISLFTTWKIPEMSCSNKFLASWIFSWNSSEVFISWRVFKIAFNFWKITAETISIFCGAHLKKQLHRCIEQSFRLCGRRRGWGVSREQHRNMYII